MFDKLEAGDDPRRGRAVSLRGLVSFVTAPIGKFQLETIGILLYSFFFIL